MALLNHYSFLAGSAAALLLLAILLFRDGASRGDVLVLVAVAGALGLSWLAVRPGPSTLAESSAVEAALASGRPTLVEFQSEY